MVAETACFMLGGLWFMPLLGKHWDRAVGFSRPENGGCFADRLYGRQFPLGGIVDVCETMFSAIR
ncbi:hypothetical protein [Methylomonas koyamae]|uniref:hypothetical protein n=1 Tax=Methylomonas koyamae TaxID=702114 RepID=UPI0028738CBB|nr:hypothetical protein [Methylomonas koyamae]WNB75508.1 hypothetical protein RI210_19855 [Methylomonas koyamae]